MADKPSKSRKKKLRLVASGAWVSKATRTELNMQRAVSNLLSRSEDYFKLRPRCALDAQAVELGVYDAAYHCMNRKARKSIVSTALTARKAA